MNKEKIFLNPSEDENYYILSAKKAWFFRETLQF